MADHLETTAGKDVEAWSHKDSVEAPVQPVKISFKGYITSRKHPDKWIQVYPETDSGVHPLEIGFGEPNSIEETVDHWIKARMDYLADHFDEISEAAWGPT